MMSQSLSAETVDRLSRDLGEPEWLALLRREAWSVYPKLSWPNAGDDIWRRTDVSLLDPFSRGFAVAVPSLLQSIALTEPFLDALLQPLAHEQLAVRANGAWLKPPSYADGLLIQELAMAAQAHPQAVRSVIEADGMTEAERKLTCLNAAFHHDDLFIQAPEGWSSPQPLRLVRFFSIADHQAVFPMTVVVLRSGSALTLIDESISSAATEARDAAAMAPHLVNGRIELVLEPGAKLHYVRLQRWGPGAREFLFQRSTLEKDSALTLANLNLGASLSKAHIVTHLAGEGASTQLHGFVFGQGAQHVDQHTLQDHQAPRTSSDLHFRAALQDESHMVYTGLIRIAKAAQQTSAYQSNHNLLLSRRARAETIPMLEILADDVQCKHGASISPIDDEQAFYLMSRGIPKEAAQRLLVMGFVEPIIRQIPFEPLQERLRQEIEEGLHEERR